MVYLKKKNEIRTSYYLVTCLESVEFDPTSLHARQKAGKGSFMPDDNGKGNLELFRVQKNDLVVVRQEMQGMFFDKNCYIIKYSSVKKRGGVIYFWQVQ